MRKVFGLNMRRLRLTADLSQEAAADIIGIGRAHAGAMERGEQNVTLLVVDKVASGLECRAMDLLDETAARAFAQTEAKARRRRARAGKRPAR